MAILSRKGVQDQKERGRYIAKGDAVDPVTYYRVGEGFSETNESLNPQTQQTNYVNGKTSSTTTGFQESWAISGERYVGDVANDMLSEMSDSRAKGPDAALIIVTVNFYEELESESVPGAGAGIYRAFRQTGSYSPESGGGGAATDTVTISGTINGSGEPVEGWFKPTGAPTTDSPELVARDLGIFSVNPDLLLP